MRVKTSLATAATVFAAAALPASAATSPVLGSASFARDGSGFGHAHPTSIFNGGDPSGSVSHLHWRHWGSSVTTAYGKNPLFKPHGGYYSKLGTIELRASNLGTCAGSGNRAYRKLEFRAPKKPGGKLGKWQLWSGAQTICEAPS